MHAVAAVFASIVTFVSGLFGSPLLASNSPIDVWATQPTAAATAHTEVDGGTFNAPATVLPLSEEFASAPLFPRDAAEQRNGRVLGVQVAGGDAEAPLTVGFLSQFSTFLRSFDAYLTSPLASGATAYPRYGGYVPATNGTMIGTVPANTALASPVITGGSITNASSGSFDALSAGTLALSGALTGTDATFSGTLSAGTLNVAGVSSQGALIGPYFNATSTLATSTFAGALDIGGVIATNGIPIVVASTTNGNYFFGAGAGNLGATGGANSALGLLSLFANTTGSYNSAFGAYSLNTNTTGSFNTALGSYALGNNTSAVNAVAIGFQAAYGLVPYTNQGGTYVGYGAGAFADNNSDYNTFLGYLAGANVTTGSNNIWIGTATSSLGIANLTTGSQNILIGNNISLPSPTASGQLNIGNILFGTGITGTGSTVSTGNVGIGTSTPSATFAVQGNAYIFGNATSTSLFSTTASSTNLFAQTASLGTLALPGMASSILSTNISGQLVATTSIGWNLLKGPASSLFAFDASGNPTATTSIGANYITGTLGTVNGETFTRGNSITITAASSSILGDNNTWSGKQVMNSGVNMSGFPDTWTSGGNCGLQAGPLYNSAWGILQTNCNWRGPQWQLYSSAQYGRGTAAGAVITASVGSFTGLQTGVPHFYFVPDGSEFGSVYTIQTVTDSTHVTLTSSPPAATGSWYFVADVSTSVSNCSGSTCSWVSGETYIPFLPSKAVINGTVYTVTAATLNELTLSPSPGTQTAVTVTQFFNDYDTLGTMRVQGVWGGNEENLNITARAIGTYEIYSGFAGSGQYRPILIRSGNSGAPFYSAYTQIDVHPDGNLSLGGAYNTDALRIQGNDQQNFTNFFYVPTRLSGQAPTLQSGSNVGDTDVGMSFDTKGAGQYLFTSHSQSAIELKVLGAGAHNFLNIYSDNVSPGIFADGTDANVDIALTAKGSGAVLTPNNVGIGTTTPWGKLSITGSGTGTGLAFAVADSANTPRFVIQDNGNVGIGTTTPGSLLSINNVANFATGGSTFYSPASFSNAITFSSTLKQSRISDPVGDLFISTGSLGVQTGPNYNAIVGSVVQDGSNGASFPTGVTGYAALRHAGNTAFGMFSRADCYTAGTCTTEFNSFNYSAAPSGTFPQNKGFGTPDTVPITLTLAAGGDYQSAMAMQIDKEGASPNSYIAGIYTNPGAISHYGLLIDADATNGPILSALLKNTGQGSNTHLTLQTTGTAVPGNKAIQHLDAGGSPTWWITQGGTAYLSNLGIGTTTPGTQLTVQNGIDTWGFYKQYGTNALYSSTTNATFATGASGAAAWMSASSTLWGSVAVGSGALATTPTSGTSQYNTAVGVNALFSNQTGANQTALGYAALFANTTGHDNTALGFGTLQNNTTGYFSTAIGVNALNANTTGLEGLAIGYTTLASNTAGSFNVAVGNASMLNSTVGVQNVGLGHHTLYYATSSNYTVGIGNRAFEGTAAYANEGGTAVGFQTGLNVANGANYNTLLGYQAGYDITTGSNNTLIGQFVTTGAGITTGSNNILLGQGVRAGLSPTGSSQLNIGNLIFGTGLGSNATMATGNVGIGTVTPGVRLETQGSTATGSVGTEEIFKLYRPINGGVSFPQAASLALGTYGIGPSFAPGSRLDFKLKSTSFDDDTTNVTVMTMQDNGNVGIGTTTPTAQFSTTGTVRFAALGSAGANLITDALGNVTASSDERLKDKQGDFTRGLAAVNAISPVMYKWRPETGFDTQSTYAGFFAQNVQASIPEAVSQDSRGYLTLADRPILAAAINAIKELSAKLDALQAAMSGFAERFTTGVLFAREIHGDMLCAGNVCVNEQQLAALLSASGSSYTITRSSNRPATPLPEPDNDTRATTTPTSAEQATSTSPVSEQAATSTQATDIDISPPQSGDGPSSESGNPLNPPEPSNDKQPPTDNADGSVTPTGQQPAA